MNATQGPLGTVAGHEVPGALLEARLARLRSGPMAARLPPDGGREGRRLRRWIAQLILTEELVRVEAARLGVPDPDPNCEPDGVGSESDTPRERDGRPAVFALRPAEFAPEPAELAMQAAGSLASAVLAAMPLARAVYRRVTADLRVDVARARDYYRRNPELWEHPERRTLRHVLSARPPEPTRLRTDGMLWTCTRDELAEPLGKYVFSATPGAIVGPVNTPFGWQICLVEGVTPAHLVNFDTVRDQILARLTRSACDCYFDRWIEQRRVALVTVASGCEHPGDPRHSDYVHHH